MSDLLIADVSEFQPDIDWAAYGAENPAVIVRAHSGGRTDKWWVQNSSGAADHCQWWAAYQYLRANDDPAADARAFLNLLDALPWTRRPACTIVDIEEGSGDQQLRQHRWLTVMADDPARDWTYSGDYFARTHGLTVEWIAAYQSREPTAAHQLWQSTDKQQFAGIAAPCDGSIFHGSIDDLIALTGGQPAPPPEDDMPKQAVFNPPADHKDAGTYVLGAHGEHEAVRVLDPAHLSRLTEILGPSLELEPVIWDQLVIVEPSGHKP